MIALLSNSRITKKESGLAPPGVFAWVQALADECGALAQNERVTIDRVHKMRSRQSAFKTLSTAKLKQKTTPKGMRRVPVDTVVFQPYDGRKA
jgi:hypothetical protein